MAEWGQESTKSLGGNITARGNFQTLSSTVRCKPVDEGGGEIQNFCEAEQVSKECGRLEVPRLAREKRNSKSRG